MRRIIVIAVLAIVMTTNSALAGIIDGYSPARHDRFTPGTFPAGTPPTPNGTFYQSGFDFSGVGWVPGAGPSTMQFAMVSPTHFICAQHFLPGLGTTVAFRAKDGSYQTRTVALQTQIVGDVAIGELSSALPQGVNGIASYPIGVGPNSAFLGKEILMFEQQGRVGRNISGIFDNQNIGNGATNIIGSDYDTNLNFDGFGTLGPPTDEMVVTGGDSGSPTFLIHGGQISLLGHHVFQYQSGSTPVGTGDSFLPSYVPQIAAELLLDGFVLGTVPVPEPSSMLLGGMMIGAIGWYRRRRAA